LPSDWHGAFVFLEELPGRYRIPPQRESTAVALRAAGMGWISAAGLANQAHRRLLQLGIRLPKEVKNVGGGAIWDPQIDVKYELRRDRATPMQGRVQDSSVWNIYLDNLFQWEVFRQQTAG